MRESLPIRAKRRFAMLLLLAALMVRAAIPQGYMVESDRPGSLTITICHSDAVFQIPFKMHGMHKGKSSHGEQQPCAYAAAANATPPTDVLPLPLPDTVAEQFAESDAPFALVAAARQLPPARAPPSRA